MSPADIAEMRATACRVFAEMGIALAALEDLESRLQETPIASLLAHEQAETASNALEAAAAHLDDLVKAADRVTTALAPKGVEP